MKKLFVELFCGSFKQANKLIIGPLQVSISFEKTRFDESVGLFQFLISQHLFIKASKFLLRIVEHLKMQEEIYKEHQRTSVYDVD